jgi:hypothetical protein
VVEFRIKVGFSTTRPIVPDQRFVFAIIEAGSAPEAQMLAAQMSMYVPCPFFGCACVNEMPTSTEIVSVEI